jgi:hypothetical protein
MNHKIFVEKEIFNDKNLFEFLQITDNLIKLFGFTDRTLLTLENYIKDKKLTSIMKSTNENNIIEMFIFKDKTKDFYQLSFI